MTTWEIVKEKINGLWPSASWNQEERNLWEKTLYSLDQWALTVALDDVAMKYTREKPALRWVLDSYKQIKTDNRPKEDRDQIKNIIEEEERHRDYWVNEIKRQVEKADPGDLAAAADRINARVGFKIDTDRPVDEWSHIALGFIHTELENEHDRTD